MAPNLYDIGEAAEYLHVDRSTVFVLLKRGELGSVKIGKRRLFSEVHLADYLATVDIPATGRSKASA